LYQKNTKIREKPKTRLKIKKKFNEDYSDNDRVIHAEPNAALVFELDFERMKHG